MGKKAMPEFQPGQQVYIERGHWYRRHAKFLGVLPLQKDFCIVQLYTVQGEISQARDIVPLSHIRAVVEHHAD